MISKQKRCRRHERNLSDHAFISQEHAPMVVIGLETINWESEEEGLVSKNGAGATRGILVTRPALVKGMSKWAQLAW